TAAEVALNGVREEARVGQRTTLDVLNAQQDLVNARVALVTAQRDRVVASYTVLAATGALSPQILGLRIEVYDPVVHYQQVRDAGGGVRAPDGRSGRIAHALQSLGVLKASLWLLLGGCTQPLRIRNRVERFLAHALPADRTRCGRLEANRLATLKLNSVCICFAL